MLSFLESLSLVRGLISFRHCKISHKIHATKIFCVQKSKYSHILEPNQVCCARTRRAIDCKAEYRPTSHRSYAEKASEVRRKANGPSPKSRRPIAEKPTAFRRVAKTWSLHFQFLKLLLSSIQRFLLFLYLKNVKQLISNL